MGVALTIPTHQILNILNMKRLALCQLHMWVAKPQNVQHDQKPE